MDKTISIAFFDTKPYDREFFNPVNASGYGYDIRYFENRLTAGTLPLAEDCRVICVFVNDTLSAEIIAGLKAIGVELIALRCAGYNNVDLKAAYRTIHVV